MKYIFIINILIITFFSCKSSKNQEDIVARNFAFSGTQFDFAFTEIDKALSMDSTAAVKRLVSPRTIESDGSLGMVASRDWCSGFSLDLCGICMNIPRIRNGKVWHVDLPIL